LASQGTARLEKLTGEAFVAFQSGLKIREEIDRAFAAGNVRVRVALEFDNIETIKRAIEIGSGVSLLPAPTIARELESGSLAQVALDGLQLERPLEIIHRRDRKINETARQFIQLLQSQSASVAAAEAAAAKATESNGHSRPRVPATAGST